MRIVGRNLVTVLLIVVMSMPALSPPVLRHSHAEGDRSHSHHIPAVAHHGHSHSHGSSHSHSSRHLHRTDLKTVKHSHDGCEFHSATPPVEHDHVFWFGFATSLPAPDRSDSPRAMPNVDQWIPLISEVRLPDPAQDGLTLLTAELCTLAALTPRLVDRSEIRPLRQSAVNLLCDTARRERSGVLVI